ncbi:MAG: BamA/TamA family outer membrane protein [Ferruginibacter sp.]
MLLKKITAFIIKISINCLRTIVLYSILFGFFFITPSAFSQNNPQTKTIEAGREYKKSGFFQSLWGKHYRKEWSTPVAIKIAMLDTLAGGLTPYEIGGSRQTKSVKLRDKNNREYVLRSIDKSFSGALPAVAKGSFIEKIANDQISIAHPYAAVTIAPMAEAAGIYHTNPQIYYIPKQQALGKFNDEIGDNVYLFEQRPDENWETAANFGNSKNIKSTENTIEKILKDNDNEVDQLAFARARLFDMFIGDWGRHEDQWRWAAVDEGKTTNYKPIPRDRDQAYTLFDGSILSAVKGLAAPHLESFKKDIKRVGPFNYPARNLDRHFLNEITLEQWRSIAIDLQQRLSNEVIDNAVKQLPPEVYDLSGPAIAVKLRSRREHLVKYAQDFYKILAKAVDVTGSEKREFFEVKRLNDDVTEVNIYKLTGKGKASQPFYSRTFHKSETFEIRLYGIGGEDEYEVTGNVKHGISVRLIGGDGKDKFTDASHVKGVGHKTEIYDNAGNEIIKTKETSVHISSDTAIHEFKYASYKFDKKGFRPIVLYNNEDRIYVGLSYIVTKNKWRKEPYGFKQYFDVKYSLLQHAFSGTYKSTFTKLIGKWDGVFYANYDYIRWTNFFGLGNDTKIVDTFERNYYRIRSHSYLANIGVERIFNGKHRVYINGFYNGIDILRDTARYIAKSTINNLPGTYDNKGFIGVNVGYVYQKLNDSILPTKGIGILVTGNYTKSFNDNSISFARFGTEANWYLPVTKNLGVMVRAGAYTVTGKPDFFQYNKIGSSESLRGYRRERFYGNSSFFDQNELRWISNVRSYIYNGKLGIFALYDVGRVWLKNENSTTIHHACGGGVIISPYNKVTLSVAYAVSPEESNIHLKLFKVF